MPSNVSDRLNRCAARFFAASLSDVSGAAAAKQFGGDGFELFDGQAGGVFGEEAFHVQCQVVVLLADRRGDDLRMIHAEIAGTPGFCGHRHPIRQRPAELHPPAAHAPDSPDMFFTYCVVDAAPSKAKAPVRSARSISRHVNSST